MSNSTRMRRPTLTDISWVVLFILALPFFIISLFNHPLGDDYWITAMVREHGYIRAQAMLYSTVTSRYSLLAITGLSPLTFGNFWLYKIIPVLFIPTFGYTIAYFFRSIVQKGARRSDVYLLSATLVVIFIAVMPGLGEGLYWFSAMVCYLGGLLFLLWWLALWIRFHSKEYGGWGYGVGCCLVFAALMGFIELLSLLATGLVVLILIVKITAKKNVRLELILLLIAGLAWCVLVGTRSFGRRYLSVLNEEDVSFFYAVGYVILQVGYHIGKCLLNPVLWVGIILGAGPMIRLAPYLAFDMKKIRQNLVYIVPLWLGSIFLLSFLTYYFIQPHLVPLRITNMIVFIFFLGVVLGGMLLYDSWGKNTKIGELRSVTQYHYLVLSGLFCLALILKNNYSTSWVELFSGKMSRYDQQMKQRYRLIENCTSNTCRLPYLENIPSMIRFTIYDTDAHLNEYFRKDVVFY